MDALQVFVRGFETQSLGNQIVESLDELGFRVRFMCSGENDTQGGLIETEIDFVDNLGTDDVETISEAVSIKSGVILQYRTFIFDEEGEMVSGAKIETKNSDAYRLVSITGDVIAAGTKDQMFRYVKHHVEDGRYRVAGPEMILDVVRKDGIVGPDPDGVQIAPVSDANSSTEGER